jgi:hypothetical protein
MLARAELAKLPAVLPSMLLLELPLLAWPRNVCHASQSRHLESEEVSMAFTYVSSPTRRFLVSSGLLTVRANHDFAGNGAGGARPHDEVSDACMAEKSE